MNCISKVNVIYNEDCLKTMSSFEDNFISHCITSPPYNYNLRIHTGKYIKRTVNEKTKYNKEYHDAMPIDDYFEWQKSVLNELLRVTNGMIFYNIQLLTGNKVALMRLIGHFADKIKEVIIWDKINAEPAMGNFILNSGFEFIIIFDKNNSLSRQFIGANFERGTLSNVFRIKKNYRNKTKHSAAFPLELPHKILQNFTKKNDLVYDPFMGIGTTALACLDTDRRFIGSEISENFHKISLDTIKSRLVQKTLF